MTNFTILDWLIVIAYVVLAGGMGIWARRYVKDMTDFVVAGRQLSVYAAIATLSGTEMGLVTVMYMAEQGYLNGFSAFAIGIIAFLGMFTLGVTGFLIRKFRESGAMTIAEYYEIRYSKNVRLFGGLVIALAGILNMGVFLKAGAMFLTQVTGMPETMAFLGAEHIPVMNVMMTVLLVIVLCYTLLGGMVSVVVTDYMQYVVLSIGVGLSTLFIFWKVGLGNIADAVVIHRGMEGLSPFLNRHYGWTFLIWQLLLFLTASATWQTAAMRVSASKDVSTAMRMYRWSSLTWMGRAIVPMLWGCAALTLFGVAHDDNALTAMPKMLAQVVPLGIIGILVAGMLAAFMSTHDSYLLAWSSVLTQDVIAPLFKKGLSQRARVALTRFLILLIGIFLLVWGLWYELPGTMWNYLALTGTMYLSGTLALMVCGMYWKRANVTGAYWAISLGIIFPVIQLFVNPALNWVSPRFACSDLKNPTALVAKLQEPPDPVSKHLRESLSYQAVAEVDALRSAQPPSEELERRLVGELNRVLAGNNLYTPKRYEDVELDKKTRALIGKKPRGKKLVRLNRLLLAQALPKALARDRVLLPAGVAGLLAYLVAMAGMILGSLHAEKKPQPGTEPEVETEAETEGEEKTSSEEKTSLEEETEQEEEESDGE